MPVLFEHIQALMESVLAASILQMTGLVLARLLPMMALTPIFGGQMIPARFRFGVSMVFTLALLPGVLPTPLMLVAWPFYLLLLAKEFVVGLVLAMFMLVLFQAMAAAGALIDLSRGAASATLLAPHVGGQQSVLGHFKMQLAIVLFLTLRGHAVLFNALGDSFITLRPDQMLPAGMMGVHSGSAMVMIELVSDLFVVALRLAAPVLVVVFLLDVCLGLINRVAPQIQVFFLGLTIKGTLGILVVFLALGLMIDVMRNEFIVYLDLLQRQLAGLGG